MTPASPLSRLEKLAEEYWIHCPLPAKGSENYANEVRSAFNAGGKAMLQILSEPGEACGPHAWLSDSEDQRYYNEEDLVEWGTENLVEFCEVSELLQARAAQAKAEAEAEFSHNGYCGSAKIADELQAQLASSEARVRILSEALEKISSSTCKKKTQTHTLNIDRANDALFELGATARQALLEVQR